MARVPGLRVRAGNRLGRARPRLQPARRPQRGRSAHGDSECVERDFRRWRRRRSSPRLNRRPHTPGPALWRRSRGCLRALAPGQWCLRPAALHAFEDRELLSRPPWDLHGCLRPVCRHGGGHRRLAAFVPAHVPESAIVISGATVCAVALLSALIPAAAPVAYIVAGLAIAPIFPTGIVWLAKLRPGDARVTSWLFPASMVGGAIIPGGIGAVIGRSGVGSAPAVLAVVAVGCLASFWLAATGSVRRAEDSQLP